MKVSSSFVVIYSSNNFFHKIRSKKVYIAFNPLPLVYGLYSCENVDNCKPYNNG